MSPLKFLLAGFVSFLFLASSATAGCPRLEGQYWCMTGPEHLDLLTVGHSVRADGVHVYTIDYSTIPGEPDVIYADMKGIPDNEGWITKCTANEHLLSLREDHQAMETFTSRAMAASSGPITIVSSKNAHGRNRTSAAGRQPRRRAHFRRFVVEITDRSGISG